MHRGPRAGRRLGSCAGFRGGCNVGLGVLALYAGWFWFGTAGAALMLLWTRTWVDVTRPQRPGADARLIWYCTLAVCYVEQGNRRWLFADEVSAADYAAARRQLLANKK